MDCSLSCKLTDNSFCKKERGRSLSACGRGVFIIIFCRQKDSEEMQQKRILTIQDLSCLGKCSLSLSIAVISAMGHEAVALPTALLSTHTSEFKDYSFLDLASETPKIIQHWKALDLTFDAIYIGYLGSGAQVDNILTLLRILRKNAVVLVDPVMGENGALYDRFDHAYVQKMRTLCQYADIITPNLTEKAFLGTDLPCRVIETGVREGNQIGVRCGDKTWYKPYIPGQFYGTGDAFSSAFISVYMKFGDFERAIEEALNFVWGSIEKTLEEKQKYWYGIQFEKNLAYLVNLK